jgi:tRNA threonylcarbamoyladenosine biosynthesis protein TsaE
LEIPSASRQLKIDSHGPDDTRSLGVALGRLAAPGDVFALYGGLGAGKTCLALGALEGAGVTSGGRSPTFTLINEHQGRLPVYHMDAYRLDGPADLADLGADEYLYGDGLTLVEWADRVEAALPERRLEIRIIAADASGAEVGRDRRAIGLLARGERYAALLDALAGEWSGP